MNTLIYVQKNFKQVCKKFMVETSKEKDHVN